VLERLFSLWNVNWLFCRFNFESSCRLCKEGMTESCLPCGPQSGPDFGEIQSRQNSLAFGTNENGEPIQSYFDSFPIGDRMVIVVCWWNSTISHLFGEIHFSFGSIPVRIDIVGVPHFGIWIREGAVDFDESMWVLSPKS
jgi:hypothetical protein